MTTKVLNQKIYVLVDAQIDENANINYSYLTKDYHYIQSSRSVSRAIPFQSPEEAIEFLTSIPELIKNNTINVDLSDISLEHVQVYELESKYIDTTKIREKLMEKDNFQSTFGEAVSNVKQGHLLARKGWNGKNMYIYFVPAASYPAQRNKNKEGYKEYENEMVEYTAYIALKNAQDIVTPWAPSQDDMLKEDWGIVPVN